MISSAAESSTAPAIFLALSIAALDRFDLIVTEVNGLDRAAIEPFACRRNPNRGGEHAEAQTWERATWKFRLSASAAWA
jgi:hypothetical protein